MTDHSLHQVIGHSVRIVANSKWMRDRLVADGISPEIICVVHSPHENPPIAAEWTPPEQPPAILFVGRLVDVKAADHVLEASARIHVEHRVWIVGDGPCQTRLERLANSLGIAKRVVFYGSLEPSEIAKLRLRSTLGVVPSVWPENFGRVGPESLAARRPVVGYNVGGIAEWLHDGVNGRLLSVGDIGALAQAIEQIITSPQLAQTLGENGARDAAQWIAPDHGVQIEAVYRNALSSWHNTAILRQRLVNAHV